MSYAMGNMLVLDDGSRWGPFSSHWAAVAAMLRLSDRAFASLGDDQPCDLMIERDLRQHIDAAQAETGYPVSEQAQGLGGTGSNKAATP